MALRLPSDEELVQMSTAQLRELLEQNIITEDQHHELRIRRRRLQNRTYARRCAKKKQNEVANLEAEALAEWNKIQSLKLQLSRLTASSDRLDDYMSKLLALKANLKDPNFSIPMVSSDGRLLGNARLNPNITEAQYESGMISPSLVRSSDEEEVFGSSMGDDFLHASAHGGGYRGQQQQQQVQIQHQFQTRGRRGGDGASVPSSSRGVGVPSVGFRSSSQLCGNMNYPSVEGH